MTFTIILVVVLAFILAPIIALKPRGNQRRIEKLRLFARQKGALFSLRRLPALKTKMKPSEPVPVYTITPGEYLLANEEWILRRTDYSHELNFFKEWDWATDFRPPDSVQHFLLKRLVDLPPSVLGLSAGHSGVAVYWLEEGGEETFLALLDLLQHIRAIYH